MNISYGVSIVIKVTTTLFGSLGLIIQRWSHIKNDRSPPDERKNALKRPLWHIGFWLNVLTSLIGGILSLSLPILLLAPLGTSSLLFNAIFAHFILKEDMTIYGIIGTLLIAASCAGIAIILYLPEIPKTSKELVKLVSSKSYIIYIVLTGALLISFAVCGWCLIRKLKKTSSTTALDEKRKDTLKLFIAIFFILSSGLLASQAIIFAKITYDLLKVSIDTTVNQFKDAISIVILILTVVTALFQLFFLNISLHYYTTLIIIPIGYAEGIILACLNTLIYYDAFSKLDWWKNALVILCTVTILGGIFLLSIHHTLKHKDN